MAARDILQSLVEATVQAARTVCHHYHAQINPIHKAAYIKGTGRNNR